MLLPAEAIPTPPPVLVLTVSSQHKHLCSLLRKWISWNIICSTNIIIIFFSPEQFPSPTYSVVILTTTVEEEPDKDKQPRGWRERRSKEQWKCLPEPGLQINEFCVNTNPQISKIQFLFKPLHLYNFLFGCGAGWLSIVYWIFSHTLTCWENYIKFIGTRWVCTCVRKKKQAESLPEQKNERNKIFQQE